MKLRFHQDPMTLKNNQTTDLADDTLTLEEDWQEVPKGF